jgi:hypothetical protein
MLVGTAVCLAFWSWSSGLGDDVRRAGLFLGAPLYGHWTYRWSPPFGALALAVSVGFAVAVQLGLLLRRLPTWLFLTLLVIGATAVAFCVNWVRGTPRPLVRVLCSSGGPRPCAFYGADLGLLQERGIRGFVEAYPDLMAAGAFTSVQNRTHPPGALVLWGLLHQLGGTWSTASAMALLTIAAAVPAYLMGRLLAGDRAGRVAAILFVTAPATVFFSFTSMDGVYAATLSAGAALLTWALVSRRPAVWAVAGAALGLSTFLTYAGSLLAMAAALAAAFRLRPVRLLAVSLLAAGAGGLLAIGVLRIGLGYDLLACYAAVPGLGLQPRPAWYWAVGAPMAYLITAGVGLASLGLIAIFRYRPALPTALLVLLLGWANLPPAMTRLYPGEVERTWLFSLPLLAAAAGAAYVDWERRSRTVRWLGAGVLSGLGLALAVLLSAHNDTVM